MKKDDQYVGVDEKYIPKNDDTLTNEIKSDMHNAYKGAKKYVSDKDNPEKMKSVGRTGLKIAKGLIILYIVGGIVAIGVFIFALTMFFRIFNQSENIISNTTQITDTNNIDSDSFNLPLETYKGSQMGFVVTKLLDEVINNIEKYQNHSITVSYNNTTTNIVSDIRTIKNNLESSSQYEVYFSYDSKGYINKVTIENK